MNKEKICALGSQVRRSLHTFSVPSSFPPTSYFFFSIFFSSISFLHKNALSATGEKEVQKGGRIVPCVVYFFSRGENGARGRERQRVEHTKAVTRFLSFLGARQSCHISERQAAGQHNFFYANTHTNASGLMHTRPHTYTHTHTPTRPRSRGCTTKKGQAKK